MNPDFLKNVNGVDKQKDDKTVCPARDAKCRKCSKIGHYANVCLTKLQKRYSQVAYLGVLHLERKNTTNIDWTVTIQPPDKILCGPDKNPTKTLGKFRANIEYKGKKCIEEIYVIVNLQTCRLGKPALFSLRLGPNLHSICQVPAVDPNSKFPELFKGLGVMKGCYSIKLKPAIPFAITSPRRVPIPLLKQTKAESERMVEEKVITPVKPTELCAPAVIVPKSYANVRICVDLIELNRNVMLKLHRLLLAKKTE
ncbi:hypothetical protein AVEN_186016-1 [Araneus ventricosus]|uniref:CCHC-type domain-containing protein n=1 Tax=Araneus ventricosus TaxID=182803 RepID=A0A4Y2J3D4_ARAVE|nr:hypothetical protein AVEN_186016-1 [Araneus ventricosus]